MQKYQCLFYWQMLIDDILLLSWGEEETPYHHEHESRKVIIMIDLWFFPHPVIAYFGFFLSLLKMKCSLYKVRSTYHILYWSHYTTHYLLFAQPVHFAQKSNDLLLSLIFPKLYNSLLWLFAKIAWMSLKANCESNKVRLSFHCCWIESSIYTDICFRV